MKPPKCVICGKKTKVKIKEFTLVRFKLTEEQAAYNLSMKQESKVGHPRGTDWFCDDHAERALTLKHLSNLEAIQIIKDEIKDSEVDNNVTD